MIGLHTVSVYAFMHTLRARRACDVHSEEPEGVEKYSAFPFTTLHQCAGVGMEAADAIFTVSELGIPSSVYRQLTEPSIPVAIIREREVDDVRWLHGSIDPFKYLTFKQETFICCRSAYMSISLWNSLIWAWTAPAITVLTATYNMETIIRNKLSFKALQS